MENPANHHGLVDNIEQDPIIADPKPIGRLETRQSFQVGYIREVDQLPDRLMQTLFLVLVDPLQILRSYSFAAQSAWAR